LSPSLTEWHVRQALLNISWPSASSDAENVDSPKQAIPLNSATRPSPIRSTATFDLFRLAFHNRTLMLHLDHVRFGSKADICAATSHVRFTPKSGHVQCTRPCQLWAKSGHCDHSMTLSARASSAGDTMRPSAFAVFRLMPNSYLFGACTGRSAGFSPLRMRSMYLAACRC
jgi:hypothetical protein